MLFENDLAKDFHTGYRNFGVDMKRCNVKKCLSVHGFQYKRYVAVADQAQTIMRAVSNDLKE